MDTRGVFVYFEKKGYIRNLAPTTWFYSCKNNVESDWTSLGCDLFYYLPGP